MEHTPRLPIYGPPSRGGWGIEWEHRRRHHNHHDLAQLEGNDVVHSDCSKPWPHGGMTTLLQLKCESSPLAELGHASLQPRRAHRDPG